MWEVKYKGVTLKIYPWTHPSGREYFRFAYWDSTGKRRYITRSSLDAAKGAARNKAKEIAGDALDVSSLSREQVAAVRRFLNGGDALPKVSIGDALEDWAETLPDTKHGSLTKRDVETLRDKLGAETLLSSITEQQIRSWLKSRKVGDKRTKDYRAAAVRFFSWARDHKLLPQGKTAPELVPAPRVEHKEVSIWTPDQMRKALKLVSPPFLPWIVVAGFSGVRTGEIRDWHKPPLEWKNVKADYIEVPAASSKNGKRRLAPILPNLRLWLDFCGERSGPLISEPAYHNETARLGDLMGGWPNNVLRHSYGSYRVAQTQDVAQTSHEMDNSPAMIRRHYLAAVPQEAGEEWFSITP